MNDKKEQEARLQLWQERYDKSRLAYSGELSDMDNRDAIYRGKNTMRSLVKSEQDSKSRYVRNIAAETIESQVNSTIPQPKVTAKRPEDSAKARLIEDMLRNELDRMPFEEINDLAERTVPVQGGTIYHIEWDSAAGTHSTAGELSVSMLHPKQVIPQAGVYSSIDDMDYIFIELPQTRAYIKRRYGVDVKDAEEEETATQIIAYYRNEEGGIGLFSWCGDYVLSDLEDYQARYLTRCAMCSTKIEPGEDACPLCGSKSLKSTKEDFEELYFPDRAMLYLGGENPSVELVPSYKPKSYPLVIQKNVSVYGKFLGDSDIDKIADQQNAINRLETKVIDKLISSGSYISLPPQADIEINAEDMKVIRLSSVADKQFIGVYDMEGSVAQDMAYLEQLYQEARQIIGITDSFQGRKDSTATSGKAKEFAAAQSAGRFESKRVMKNAAYGHLFELMFKFMLGYMDEPRQVASFDPQGNPEFKVFNRFDFLSQDETGNYYWNDGFLFSCDTTAPLASNREAMWQETRMNLESGAFGDPSSFETLIIFWKKMEMLHYPGASETRAVLEERLRQQEVNNLGGDQ